MLQALLTLKKNLYKWYLKVDFDLSVFIERRYPDARLARLVRHIHKRNARILMQLSE